MVNIVDPSSLKIFGTKTPRAKEIIPKSLKSEIIIVIGELKIDKKFMALSSNVLSSAWSMELRTDERGTIQIE